MIPDVLNDVNSELFEGSLEIKDTQQEESRTRGGSVIKRSTNLDDYGI